MNAAERTADRISLYAPGAVCVTRENWIYQTGNKGQVWRIWSAFAGATVHGETLKEAEARMMDVLKDEE